MYCETQNGSNIVNLIRDIEIAFAISWIKNLVKKIAANNLLWRQIDVATQFVKEKKEMTMKNIQRDNQHLDRRLIVHKKVELNILIFGLRQVGTRAMRYTIWKLFDYSSRDVFGVTSTMENIPMKKCISQSNLTS